MTDDVPFRSGILKHTRFSERGTRFFSIFKMLFTVEMSEGENQGDGEL